MTDTINTLADPGSDPAHEWQQPENAESILHAITPASLRVHADWFDTTFEPGSVEARSLRNCADRLEAESARENHLLELAKEFWCGMGGEYDDPDPEDVAQAWEDMTPEWKRRYANGVRAVLAADGRLLPEGGTVLTEEQVADLRWLMAQYVGFDGDIDCPPYASLDALFTPPAVSAHNPWDASCVRNIVGEPTRDGERCETCSPAVPVPDSGPDGTPEKPWPTSDEIPADVAKALDRDGDVWMRVGENWSCNCDCCPVAPVDMNQHAPFVRVDGDEA